MRLAILVAAVLALGASVACASPESPGPSSSLRIEGLQPIEADDLSRFTTMAVRLAAASRSDPRVQPVLEETLAQVDRGIVKRAIAYLALAIMGRETTARTLVGQTFRDRAVLRIVRACAQVAGSLTQVPGR